MKAKQCLLTMVAIFIGTIGFAEEKVKMNLVPLKAGKAQLTLNASQPTTFEVWIKNSLNETVYFYKSKEEKQTYRFKFDFHDLEFGKYRVVVNCGDSNLMSRVEYTGGDIKPGEVCELPAPCVVQKGEKLNVSMFNSEEEPVYLKFYKDNDRIARIKLGNQLCIQKKVDLSQLEKGNYRVVVSDWNKDHVFAVGK